MFYYDIEDLYLQDFQEIESIFSDTIRGATSHYDLVCAESSKGIANVGLETGVPVIFGIVTTDNIQQAIERAGTKAGNKGYDCALSAIEMVNLERQI